MDFLKTALKAGDKALTPVDWMKSHIYSILEAYSNGFTSVQDMYLFIAKCALPLAFVLAGIIAWRSPVEIDKNDKKQPSPWWKRILIGVIFGTTLAVAIVGLPMLVWFNHKMMKNFIGSSMLAPIVAIMAVLSALTVFATYKIEDKKKPYSIPQRFASAAIVSSLGTAVINAFILSFVRNSKEISILKIVKELFDTENCKSARAANQQGAAACNHKHAGLLKVVDISVPDFIEKGIEAMGWPNVFTAMIYKEGYDSVKQGLGITGFL